MDFLKEFFRNHTGGFFKGLCHRQKHRRSVVVRMVGDFQLHHAVLRRYLKHKELLTTPFFVDIRSRFRSSCEKKGYSQVTTEHYVKQSSYLMDYLAAQGMDDFNAVTLDTVHAYIRTLVGFPTKRWSSISVPCVPFSVSCTRKVSCRMTLQQKCPW